MTRVVIIGAGQAGARAALTLRDMGWDGEIMVIGEEPLPPYERPPLSKEVLLGITEGGDARIAAEEDYAERKIQIRLDTQVVNVDFNVNSMELQTGEQIAYDHLIFATGARARPLSVSGSELEGVFTLRSAEDSTALRSALGKAKRVAIIGGGFVGLEVAAAARRLDVEAVVLEQAPTCLSRTLPSAAVDPILKLHSDNDVDILCNSTVVALEGNDRVKAVLLGNGTTVQTDLVVVGIGSIANDELASAAGIACANGIIVNDECRSSKSNVYAIGDVAAHLDHASGRGFRLESWENAERQAERVAASITGTPARETLAPWFWTDQYDLNVQIVGSPGPEDELLVRAGAAPGQFIQIYLRDGMMVGAVMFNSGREKRTLVKLVGQTIDPARMLDPKIPLRQNI